MHYRDICSRAVDEGLIQPGGLTPHASLNASITSEIRRQIANGELPRFVSHGRGFFSLALGSMDPEVETAVREHNDRIQNRLAAELREIEPRAFEQLVGRLLEAVGFDQVVVTRYSADGGIDVRGTLSVGA
jgi:restriction system protein